MFVLRTASFDRWPICSMCDGFWYELLGFFRQVWDREIYKYGVLEEKSTICSFRVALRSGTTAVLGRTFVSDES